MNKRLLSTIILTVFFCSCGSENKKMTKQTFTKKELIVGDTSNGWGADITLSITARTIDKNGNKTLTAVSSYKGQDIGLQILVLSIFSKDTSAFSSNRIIVKSLGETSDRLLSVLNKLYLLPNGNDLKFIDSLIVTEVNLDILPNQITNKENTPVDKSNNTDFNTKLFLGNTDNEKDYGEIYLNVSETNKTVELKEKDIDYRRQVIKAFSKR